MPILDVAPSATFAAVESDKPTQGVAFHSMLE